MTHQLLSIYMPLSSNHFSWEAIVTEDGWFAVRPSGTEPIYKLYMEGFKGEDHFQKMQAEAQEFLAGLAK